MLRIDYPLQHAAKTKRRGLEDMTMLLYSALLTLGLVLSSPWWLLRMMTTERYREGLRQRLGAVPTQLLQVTEDTRVVWLHAVSVGEVLAASRLVGELETVLGEHFRVVISTTTRTGQALARERFGAERVFYMPLDFAFAVRAYLHALKPVALILMESELWPRILHECSRANIPVAVVNARMSDRSFRRAMQLRRIWQRFLRKPTLWLAQSEQDALRLLLAGARRESVQIAGNLKYDIRASTENRVAETIRRVAKGRPIVVAGSTVARRNDNSLSEDEMVLRVWRSELSELTGAVLVLAPRHPERFTEVEAAAMKFSLVKASDFSATTAANDPVSMPAPVDIVLLDTVGDLASVYAVADVAFIGGSLVERGGHNPLEPAQFGVPIVMGPSFENFRDIVSKMQEACGIRIVQDGNELRSALVELLTDRNQAQVMGERGRRVFEEQKGATARAVSTIVAMIQGAKP